MAITQLQICNNALDLAGQGLHISSLSENTKEADLCNRLYAVTLQRALERSDWSFARKTVSITSSNASSAITPTPYKHVYTLPSDCSRVLFIQRETSATNRENYIEDLRFDFRINGSTKLLVTEAQAPFKLEYIANVTDTGLFPAMFTEAVEYLLAGRFAAALMKGATGLQAFDALTKKGEELLTNLDGIDPPVELPLSDRAKRVSNLLSISVNKLTLEQQRHVADAIESTYPQVVRECLDKYDWTFSRTDEGILEEHLLKGVVQIPYTYTFSLPDNCLRVIAIYPISDENRYNQLVSTKRHTQFAIRVYNGEHVLATNLYAPFSCQFVMKEVPESLMSPGFIEAVEIILASKIATDVRDGEEGLMLARNLSQQGLALLDKAHQMDYPQQMDEREEDDRMTFRPLRWKTTRTVTRISDL